MIYNRKMRKKIKFRKKSSKQEEKNKKSKD